MTPPTPPQAEPSTFALDVFWASGPSGDPAVAAHVRTCDRCRAYLDALEAERDASPPEVVPLPRPRRSPRWGWAAAGVGFLAAAAGVTLALRTTPSPGDGYVGIKGTPAVQLLVHRGKDTHVWDGRAPVHPGDALALRLVCEGLKQYVVAAPAPGGWGRLSEGPCPSTDAPLPFTLQVDQQPGDEQLAVVLSAEAVDDAALKRLVDEERRTSEAWVFRFVLPKETETDR